METDGWNVTGHSLSNFPQPADSRTILKQSDIAVIGIRRALFVFDGESLKGDFNGLNGGFITGGL
jgi:hypothetical protein